MKSKLSLVLVDLLLIAGIIACLLSDKRIDPGAVWHSFHCIVCAAWFALALFHTFQHWALIQALVKPTVRSKNRFTTLTVIVSVIMLGSILSLIVASSGAVLDFHIFFVHIFLIVIIIHTITKGKRLLQLIRKLR